MDMQSGTSKEGRSEQNLAVMGLAALGVVFGDIGTSPLYTFKTVIALAGGKANEGDARGSLSLLIWSLIVVVTVKYVSFAMRIDNQGEGGILALMSLLTRKVKHPAVIVTLGLIGAALIYGDGAVTPAISVLSAVEGLKIVAPSFGRWVLPSAVAILVALFIFQPQGTARIGKTFGPIMLVWFLTIAVLGVVGIVRHPAVLTAINPLYGFRFLRSEGWRGFLVLSGVFLSVTGAEALYADLGHFGAWPIRAAWLFVVFPSLVLCYAGQAALVMAGETVSDNIFYRLCPSALLIPMVILATVATIIASQAIISGAFSMTRQAIELGWLPRLKIVQTSADEQGQIYVGSVNWILMLATCGLALAFRKSDGLAAAYGIAVSATMLATSALLFVAMWKLWKWNAFAAGAVAGIFLLIDATFFAANCTKFASGGYVPLALAGLVYGLMLIWHKGARAVSHRLHDGKASVDNLMKKIAHEKIARVPGTGIFVTRTTDEVPPVMLWHLAHSRSLPERLLVLEIETADSPWVRNGRGLSVVSVAPKFWRATVRYGFMEQLNLPAALEKIGEQGCDIELSEATYYIGRGTILPRDDKKGLPRWLVSCFAFMQRNSTHLGDNLHLPPEAVVEVGRQVKI